MRKTPALLAVLGLSALALTGCASAGLDSCDRVEAAGVDMSSIVTVDGEFGTMPGASVFAPFHIDETSWVDVSDGEGEGLVTPAQLLVLDATMYAGSTGEQLATSAYDGSYSSVYSWQTWINAMPGLEDALACATPGTRIVVGLPAGEIDPDYAATVGLGADESAVLVVDIQKVYLSKANGADQFTDSNGLPSVVRAPDGRPGVVIPDIAAPTDLVVQVIKKGDGAVVTADDAVRVHYTGLLWDTGEVFDTSWDGDPVSMTLDGVIDGFAQALDGQTVGSQILVVIPPELGYGDTASGSIPAGSTLVFVIDILGIDGVAS
ncbi:FKBP-type peptidyl-prolyl cis-trans isomerase [Microbacterium sediminicola]|uniref:Peptidyl-prolyl cis-trans isomerase n=1 Tax=Microbacterium sediminicola TaxID=415210 RepID=A0ABN2HUS4_9MICO